MSATTNANGDDARNEHNTQTRTYAKPDDHGYTGAFNLDDAETSTPDHFPDEYRNFDDGGAYQHARAAYVKNTDEPNDRVVLTKDYNPSWHPDDYERFAIVLTSSRWKAGEGTGDDYSAYYKYDLTLRPVGVDGEVNHDETPLYSLNVKLLPQYDGMNYADGNSLELPHGEGTRVRMQTTWTKGPVEAFVRTAELLEEGIGYKPTFDDIKDDSKRNVKQEAHLRFTPEKDDDVRYTVQQSADLIPHLTGDVEDIDGTTKEGGRWDIYAITSTDWDRLGYPDLNVNIRLKVYYPPNPAKDGYMSAPKLEAAMNGTPSNEELPTWDEYEKVQHALRAIVASHLLFAGVSRTQLVADDVSDGEDNEDFTFQQSMERRKQLRQHYADLTPTLYHEIQRESTDLVYDILTTLLRNNGTATYEQLKGATGAPERTIRDQVRRLEIEVGGEMPGILERVQSKQTHITFTGEMQYLAEDAVEKARPDETPADREERAEERQEGICGHECEDGTECHRTEGWGRDAEEGPCKHHADDHNDTDAESEATDEPSTADDWRRLSTLSAGFESARTMPQSEVQVNVAHPAWDTNLGTQHAPGDD